MEGKTLISNKLGGRYELLELIGKRLATVACKYEQTDIAKK